MRPAAEQQCTGQLRRRDLAAAFLCGGFAALMIGAAYAAVPLYSWFCRTTGFGGTTRVASALPTQQSARMVTVRFDSNVAAGLPWSFRPERNTIDVKLGQVVTVYQDGVSTITLSYTFYPVRGSAPSAAESAPPPAHGPARQLGRI